MFDILVVTGLGYFKDAQDHIIAKAELPSGPHPCKNGFIYIEVSTQAEFDAIKVYKDPQDAIDAANSKKVTDKIRGDAIAALIATGDLPADYQEK